MLKKIGFIQKAGLFLFGIFLFLVLLEAGLRISGWQVLFWREKIDGFLNAKFDGLKILCVGESTTYDGGAYSYPSSLQRVLDVKNLNLKFKVINRGIPGIKTQAIVNQLSANLDKYNPQVVVIMMGVNDSANIRIKEIIQDKDSYSLKGLRIYKLFKLIQLSMVKENKPAPQQSQPGDELNEKKISFLRKVIEDDPANSFARLAFSSYCRGQNRNSDIENMYKKAISKKMPLDELARVYADLARFYWENQNFGQIERMYREAIKENPGFVRFYCDLGNYYRDREKYKQAEQMFRKALDLEPANNIVYDNFGDFYEKQGKHKEAQRMYQKAKELSSEHMNTAFELRGKEFREIGRYSEIEKLYTSILEIDPKDSFACYQLGKSLEKQGKFDEAEKMYKFSIEFNRNDYKGYGTLALFYQNLGKEKLASEYFKKAREIKFKNFYSQQIISDYLKAKSIVLGRNIILVWVQYPMWEVQPLEEILGQGVIFVDNEKTFKEAVAKKGYQAYFIDRFAGDFGHCTKEGNKLIADNICEVLLKALEAKHKITYRGPEN